MTTTHLISTALATLLLAVPWPAWAQQSEHAGDDFALLGDGMPASVPQGESETQPKDAPDAQALAAAEDVRFFTSGSGEAFLKVGISATGNIASWESPEGVEHISRRSDQEGYAVTLHGSPGSPFEADYFDAGVTEGGTFGGFGPPSVSQPGGAGTFPLVITRRDPNDGSLELKQTFTRNAAEKAVTVQMTITNRFGGTISRVDLARYFDGDVGGTSQNIYDQTENAVWARNASTPKRALMLTNLTFTARCEAAVERFGDWDPLGTGNQTARQAGAAVPVAVPTAVGDFVGRLPYELGELKPGQSKTVKVQYRNT